MTFIRPIRKTVYEKYLLWKEEHKRRHWLRNYNLIRNDGFRGIHGNTKMDDSISYTDKAS